MLFVRKHLLASLSLCILLVAAGPAKAQVFAPLDAPLLKMYLQAEKLKAEIDVNFADAARFEKSNPVKARELLRSNRVLLDEGDELLPEKERKELMRKITIGLYKLNDLANAEKHREHDEAAQRQIEAFVKKLRADQEKEEKRRKEIQNEIAELEKRIEKLKAELVKPPQPMSKPTIHWIGPRDSVRQPIIDLPIPAKELQLKAKDILLMKALNSATKISAKSQPLQDVLELIEDLTKGDLAIVVDERGLKEAKIDPAKFLKEPITLEFKAPVKVRVILRKILSERGMGYYVGDGILYITPIANANQKLIVKNYPVSNLVDPRGQDLVNNTILELRNAKPDPRTGEIEFGPKGMQLNQNIENLSNRLKCIEPNHWKNPDGSGGPATMAFIPATSSMQINCSLEVHYLLIASRLLDNVNK